MFKYFDIHIVSFYLYIFILIHLINLFRFNFLINLYLLIIPMLIDSHLIYFKLNFLNYVNITIVHYLIINFPISKYLFFQLFSFFLKIIIKSFLIIFC